MLESSCEYKYCYRIFNFTGDVIGLVNNVMPGTCSKSFNKKKNIEQLGIQVCRPDSDCTKYFSTIPYFSQFIHFLVKQCLLKMFYLQKLLRTYTHDSNIT